MMLERSSLSLVLLLVSSSLMAAERIEHTVTVTAQVPTDKFYVVPVGDWINSNQKLTFNPYSQKLEPVVRLLDMKSTIGPIKANLVFPPVVVSGKDNIALSVKVAGVTLSTSPVELLNKADASTGKQVSLEIIPAAASAGGYKPGNYQGIVSMLFESDIPPATPPAT